MGTFFFMLAGIMSIAIVFDVSERLEEFMNSSATAHEIIFDYYLNFTMYYANLFSAMFIFISVIWFTGRLAQNSEIIAILSSGVGYNRLLRPYFIGATILTVLSLVLNHFILPSANLNRLDFEEAHIRKSFNVGNILRQNDDGSIIYFKSLSRKDGKMRKFTLTDWDGLQIKKIVYADIAMGDSSSNKWELENYQIREFQEHGETIQRGKKLDTTFTFQLTDFAQRTSIASTMNYSELNDYIEQERRRGNSEVVFFEIEKHQRTAYPFAAYILTLIGVAVSSKKRRGGIGIHLALGLIVAVSYIFCMKIMTVAATNAGLSTLIAVWTPNIIFAIIAFYLYKQAKK